MTDKSDYEASLEASIAKLVAALQAVVTAYEEFSSSGLPLAKAVEAARDILADQEGCGS